MLVKNYFAEYMPFDFGRLVQQFALVNSLPDHWRLEWYEFEPSVLSNEVLIHKFRLWVPDDSPVLDFVETLASYFMFTRTTRSGRFRLRGKYPQ